MTCAKRCSAHSTDLTSKLFYRFYSYNCAAFFTIYRLTVYYERPTWPASSCSTSCVRYAICWSKIFQFLDVLGCLYTVNCFHWFDYLMIINFFVKCFIIAVVLPSPPTTAPPPVPVTQVTSSQTVVGCVDSCVEFQADDKVLIASTRSLLAKVISSDCKG